MGIKDFITDRYDNYSKINSFAEGCLTPARVVCGYLSDMKFYHIDLVTEQGGLYSPNEQVESSLRVLDVGKIALNGLIGIFLTPLGLLIKACAGPSKTEARRFKQLKINRKNTSVVPATGSGSRLQIPDNTLGTVQSRDGERIQRTGTGTGIGQIDESNVVRSRAPSIISSSDTIDRFKVEEILNENYPALNEYYERFGLSEERDVVKRLIQEYFDSHHEPFFDWDDFIDVCFRDEVDFECFKEPVITPDGHTCSKQQFLSYAQDNQRTINAVELTPYLSEGQSVEDLCISHPIVEAFLAVRDAQLASVEIDEELNKLFPAEVRSRAVFERSENQLSLETFTGEKYSIENIDPEDTLADIKFKFQKKYCVQLLGEKVGYIGMELLENASAQMLAEKQEALRAEYERLFQEKGVAISFYFGGKQKLDDEAVGQDVLNAGTLQITVEKTLKDDYDTDPLFRKISSYFFQVVNLKAKYERAFRKKEMENFDFPGQEELLKDFRYICEAKEALQTAYDPNTPRLAPEHRNLNALYDHLLFVESCILEGFLVGQSAIENAVSVEKSFELLFSDCVDYEYKAAPLLAQQGLSKKEGMELVEEGQVLAQSIRLLKEQVEAQFQNFDEGIKEQLVGKVEQKLDALLARVWGCVKTADRKAGLAKFYTPAIVELEPEQVVIRQERGAEKADRIFQGEGISHIEVQGAPEGTISKEQLSEIAFGDYPALSNYCNRYGVPDQFTENLREYLERQEEAFIDWDDLIQTCFIDENFSYECFSIPVIAPDGRTYEQKDIKRWLNSNGSTPYRADARVSELMLHPIASAILNEYTADKRSIEVSDDLTELFPEHIRNAPPSGRGRGQLFGKTLTGRTVTLEMDYGDKVIKLKEACLKKVNDEREKGERLQLQDLRLVFCGKLMDDEITIDDYQLHKEGCFHIIQKLKGDTLDTLIRLFGENEDLLLQIIELNSLIDRLERGVQEDFTIKEAKEVRKKINETLDAFDRVLNIEKCSEEDQRTVRAYRGYIETNRTFMNEWLTEECLRQQGDLLKTALDQSYEFYGETRYRVSVNENLALFEEGKDIARMLNKARIDLQSQYQEILATYGSAVYDKMNEKIERALSDTWRGMQNLSKAQESRLNPPEPRSTRQRIPVNNRRVVAKKNRSTAPSVTTKTKGRSPVGITVVQSQTILPYYLESEENRRGVMVRSAVGFETTSNFLIESVPLESSVRHLCYLIAQRMDVPVDEIRIVCAGNVLSDTEVLRDTKIFTQASGRIDVVRRIGCDDNIETDPKIHGPGRLGRTTFRTIFEMKAKYEEIAKGNIPITVEEASEDLESIKWFKLQVSYMFDGAEDISGEEFRNVKYLLRVINFMENMIVDQYVTEFLQETNEEIHFKGFEEECFDYQVGNRITFSELHSLPNDQAISRATAIIEKGEQLIGRLNDYQSAFLLSPVLQRYPTDLQEKIIERISERLNTKNRNISEDLQRARSVMQPRAPIVEPSIVQPTTIEEIQEEIREQSIEEANLRLAEEIRGTRTYQEVFLPWTMQDGPVPESVPKEFFDLFVTHNDVFEGVYLGNYRGYLSVDPRFCEQHAVTDSREEITSNLENIPQSFLQDLDQKIGDNSRGTSQLGIKHVLSVTQFQAREFVEQDDWAKFQPDLEGLGVDRLQVELDDLDGFWEGLKPHLPEIFEYIDRARLANEPILVHCVKGASRSVTVLTAYLMSRCGVSMDEAYNFIRTKRTVAELKPSIIEGLREFEQEIRS